MALSVTVYVSKALNAVTEKKNQGPFASMASGDLAEKDVRSAAPKTSQKVRMNATTENGDASDQK